MRDWLSCFMDADMSQGNPTQHEIDVYAGEFVLSGDKTKSWRKTFPTSKAKPEATYVAAQKMHNMPKVLLRIDELQVKTASNDADEFDLSASELKGYLRRVADAGLEQDDSGKYSGLSATTGAIAEINRMNGNHAATKQEIAGKDGGAIEVTDMSERDLARRLGFILAKGAKQ
jgi:predicted phage tail protein